MPWHLGGAPSWLCAAALFVSVALTGCASSATLRTGTPTTTGTPTVASTATYKATTTPTREAATPTPDPGTSVPPPPAISGGPVLDVVNSEVQALYRALGDDPRFTAVIDDRQHDRLRLGVTDPTAPDIQRLVANQPYPVQVFRTAQGMVALQARTSAAHATVDSLQAAGIRITGYGPDAATGRFEVGVRNPTPTVVAKSRPPSATTSRSRTPPTGRHRDQSAVRRAAARGERPVGAPRSAPNDPVTTTGWRGGGARPLIRPRSTGRRSARAGSLAG